MFTAVSSFHLGSFKDKAQLRELTLYVSLCLWLAIEKSVKCNLQSILFCCYTHIFTFSHCSQCAHRPKFEFTLKTPKINFDWAAFTVAKLTECQGFVGLHSTVGFHLCISSFFTIQWAFYIHRMSPVVLPWCYSSPEGTNIEHQFRGYGRFFWILQPSTVPPHVHRG